MINETEDGFGCAGMLPLQEERQTIREIEALERRIKRAESILRDGALQLGRLTGPNLETYARTFAALSANWLGLPPNK